MYIKQFVWIFFFFITVSAYSQNCVISTPDGNILYAGLSAPVDFAIDGFNCKDFILVTDNGKIEKLDKTCRYFITADSVGEATIKVILKRTKKQFGVGKYRVKSIPAPVAMISNKSGGNISKNILKVQIGLSAAILNLAIDARFMVTGYCVTAYRNKQIVFNKVTENALFTDEIKEALNTIEIGDRIVFSNISYKGYATNGYLQPIEFIIIK